MRVDVYATLRPLVGGKTLEIPIAANSTLRELLAALFEMHPAVRAVLTDETGQLRGHVHVFVNGRDAHYLAETLDHRLAADDKVDVFPAVAGG